MVTDDGAKAFRPLIDGVSDACLRSIPLWSDSLNHSVSKDEVSARTCWTGRCFNTAMNPPL